MFEAKTQIRFQQRGSVSKRIAIREKIAKNTPMPKRYFCILPIYFCAFLSVMKSAGEQLTNLLLCISENHANHLLHTLDKVGSSINPTPHLSGISQSGYSHPLAYCTNAGSGNTAFPFLSGLPKKAVREEFPQSNFLPVHLQSIGYDCALFGSWESECTPAFFGFPNWAILEDNEIFFNPGIKTSKANFVIEGH